MAETPQNRSVIVTGAAMGNGLGITSRFLARGDRVVALDVNQDVLAKARAAEWAAYGDDRVMALQADVTNPADIAKAVEATMAWAGRIDVLVNNAGITGGEKGVGLLETPIEIYDAVMNVNVRAIVLLCQAVLPHMLKAGSGKIVNIASVASLVAFPGRSAYTISKGAVLQMTKSLAVDYGARGIRSNAVCPGMIRTPMTEWRLSQPEMQEAILARIPQREIGMPDQVADAVLFLASEEANYCNGTALVIDGGYTSI